MSSRKAKCQNGEVFDMFKQEKAAECGFCANQFRTNIIISLFAHESTWHI